MTSLPEGPHNRSNYHPYRTRFFLTGFPQPPKTNRDYTPQESPFGHEAPIKDVQPKAHPIPEMTAPDSRLTDEETRFILDRNLRPEQRKDAQLVRYILSYFATRHNAQSAKECGYTPGQGTYIRTRPEVHKCIEELTSKAVLKYGYDANEIIERVKEVAALDPIEFENPDGSMKTHMSQIAPEARRAIKKFKAKNLYGKDANDMPVVIGQLIEVEMYSKMEAAELLGREKNIFKETKKVEHDVTSNMASVLLESNRRALERLDTAIDVTPVLTGKTDEQE